MANLFSDPTKTLPKNPPDSFVVRTPMTENEIAGRKDRIPQDGKATNMQISHMPNAN